MSQGDTQLNVIRRTIDDQRNTLSLTNYATHVREDLSGKFRRQNRQPVLRGEYDMNQKGNEAVWHELTPRPRA